MTNPESRSSLGDGVNFAIDTPFFRDSTTIAAYYSQHPLEEWASTTQSPIETNDSSETQILALVQSLQKLFADKPPEELTDTERDVYEALNKLSDETSGKLDRAA